MTRRTSATQQESSDTRPAKLAVSLAEADRLVAQQLREGEELDQRLDAGNVPTDDDRKNWRGFTIEVLRRIFDTEEYADQFERAAMHLYTGPPMFLASGPSHPYQPKPSPDATKVHREHLNCLRLIHKSLPIIPAPQTIAKFSPPAPPMNKMLKGDPGGDPIDSNGWKLLAIMVDFNLQSCSNAELQQHSGIEDGQDVNDAIERLEEIGAVEVEWIRSTTAELDFGMVTLKGRGKSLLREHLIALNPLGKGGSSGQKLGANMNLAGGGKVFIGHGHSHLWMELRHFIEKKLNLSCVEFNSETPAGKSNKERLEAMLAEACFAFLVMTAEDEHGDGTLHSRENVIHEAGLFQGRLGFDRAIVVLEENCVPFSNIEGLGQIRFPKTNIKAAFEEVRDVLLREGITVET